MHRPKPRVSDATQEIHAKIVAKPSGSQASPKKPAATNTTKMSSTLDHMPVPPQTAALTLLLPALSTTVCGTLP